MKDVTIGGLQMILHRVFGFQSGVNDEYGSISGYSIAHLVLHSRLFVAYCLPVKYTCL